MQCGNDHNLKEREGRERGDGRACEWMMVISWYCPFHNGKGGTAGTAVGNG